MQSRPLPRQMEPLRWLGAIKALAAARQGESSQLSQHRVIRSHSRHMVMRWSSHMHQRSSHDHQIVTKSSPDELHIVSPYGCT